MGEFSKVWFYKKFMNYGQTKKLNKGYSGKQFSISPLLSQANLTYRGMTSFKSGIPDLRRDLGISKI